MKNPKADIDISARSIKRDSQCKDLSGSFLIFLCPFMMVLLFFLGFIFSLRGRKVRNGKPLGKHAKISIYDMLNHDKN